MSTGTEEDVVEGRTLNSREEEEERMEDEMGMDEMEKGEEAREWGKGRGTPSTGG